MGSTEPRSFDCRKSRVLVRTAAEPDAAALARHQEHMYSSNPFIVTERGEIDRTEPQQREWILKHAATPGHLMLVATRDPQAGPPSDGEILGALLFRCADRRRTAHHGTFGISVHADWRGRGVGTALITTLLDWAVLDPQIEKVCLGVFAENTGARALYRRLGFVEEGLTARCFKYPDGRYHDDVPMAIFVKPGLAPPGYTTWPARTG
jgi:RimJ/RimL family protein N-acetyltransferase